MTLYKQLYLALGFLFLLIFLGTFGISLNSTRAYLSQQLASTAEDTATSLGLSLTTHLAGKDLATVQSMVDAVFDRGYYRLIRVEDTAGKSVYERVSTPRIDGVPAWFIRLIPLETPTAEAGVMSGWNQAGTLRVASHPGYAYAELWRGARGNLLWFLICMGLSALAGTLLLRLILKPLRAVEHQARAICQHRYPVQDTLPRTRELRRVVQAMNRMSTRVGQMFAEQAALTEQLSHDVYIDPVTGLGNRQRFNTQMNHLLQSPDEFSAGTLLLLQLRDFKGYNDRHGYPAGDALLRQTAELLQEALGDQARLVSRLSGADFAALTLADDAEEAGVLADRVLDQLQRLSPGGGMTDAGDIGHVGLAACRCGQPLGEVMANADVALRQAQQDGPNQFRYLAGASDGGEPQEQGASLWRERLQRYLDEDALLLHLQPVADARQPGTWLNREVLLRAREAVGSLTPAGAFMSMAERTGLAQALDRRVIELADRLLNQSGQTLAPLAINLTPDAVNDADFAAWLTDFLHQRGIGPKLIFELSEYGVVRYLEPAQKLEGMLRQHGSGLAIDRFGSRFSSFTYLRDLPVRYVKLDGSYTRSLHETRETPIFVRALVNMAHELDIHLIAESVETEAEAQALTAMNVDGLQGYFIGRPQLP
jgi:diguanylate cyclase (GGDEF)-like protein